MDAELSAKINKVSREYVERMIKIEETRKGFSGDGHIDCPFCGQRRAMEFKNGLWRCLYVDCHNELPLEKAPPSPEEFKRLMQIKKDLETLVKWGLV